MGFHIQDFPWVPEALCNSFLSCREEARGPNCLLFDSWTYWRIGKFNPNLFDMIGIRSPTWWQISSSGLDCGPQDKSPSPFPAHGVALFLLQSAAVAPKWRSSIQAISVLSMTKEWVRGWQINSNQQSKKEVLLDFAVTTGSNRLRAPRHISQGRLM